MSGSNRCNCCCECGLFCTESDYCGVNMEFVLTHSGATDLDPSCTTCAADLNAVIGTVWDGVNLRSYSAAYWIANIQTDYPAQAFDPKDGTRVCIWTEGVFPKTTVVCSCGVGIGYSGGTVGPVVAVYYGTDDKWHMTYRTPYDAAGYSSILAGDAEFAGGGARMSCGTPGEATPTFSLTIPLAEYNVSGTAILCYPPTSVLVEGNPQ